jgi:positive regulator of sigma E activity
MVFFLPVIFLIAGYFLGVKLFAAEGMAIISAFAGLVLAFVILWGLNRLFARDKNFLPTIEKSIIEPLKN